MTEYIERQLEFTRAISSRELYYALQRTANITGSRWFLSFDHQVRYEPGTSEQLYTLQNDARGTIERENLQVELTVEPEHFLDDAIPADPLENYFKVLRFSEPFGWRGGIPSINDRVSLQRYMDEVKNALIACTAFEITEVQSVEH